MARPREFDLDEVLSQVMEAFWKDGYEKTSFSSIEDRTGVKKASLCAAFGDKHNLFLTALRQYQESGRQACSLALNEGSPRAAIRDWLMGVAGMATGKKGKLGCFQVNTIIELAPHDPEVAALIRKHNDLLATQLTEVIGRGQRAGEFRADVEAPLLAQYLLTSIYGLSVAGKAAARGRGKGLDRIVDLILSAFEK